jgi:hypothetical protein
MGPRSGDARRAGLILGGLALMLCLGGCGVVGATTGAVVGTAAFAAKTTVKAGRAVVRGTGRAVGATARAVTGNSPRG